VQRVKADTQVVADRGRVALRYGPLIYNVEAVDGNDLNAALASDSPLTTQWRPIFWEGWWSSREVRGGRRSGGHTELRAEQPPAAGAGGGGAGCGRRCGLTSGDASTRAATQPVAFSEVNMPWRLLRAGDEHNLSHIEACSSSCARASRSLHAQPCNRLPDGFQLTSCEVMVKVPS